MLKGPNIKNINYYKNISSVPLIASGGVGCLKDFFDGIKLGGASAVLAASVFHFKELTIKQVKNYLKSKNINVRIDNLGQTI